MQTPNSGHLEDNIVQSQHFLKTKDSQVFCKWTNNIHKFEGCFLTGQVSSSGFKVFNSCIVKYLNYIGLFSKKLENLCFQKMLWLENLLPSDSWLECPWCNLVSRPQKSNYQFVEIIWQEKRNMWAGPLWRAVPKLNGPHCWNKVLLYFNNPFHEEEKRFLEIDNSIASQAYVTIHLHLINNRSWNDQTIITKKQKEYWLCTPALAQHSHKNPACLNACLANYCLFMIFQAHYKFDQPPS